MLKKVLNLKERIYSYFRKKRIEKLVEERNINEGFIKILKIEHFNEYDFVWIELLSHEVIEKVRGLRYEYSFEIIALKNGEFLEEEFRTRISLKFKEYDENYLSLEKNKDNMFFLEVLYNKHLGKIDNTYEFKALFNVFLTKNLTKKVENEIKNFKAYFVKLDERLTNNSLNRVFIYDMDNNKFVKQIYLKKPEEDLLSENIKIIINNVINDYLEKIKTKEEKQIVPLEAWNGEL